MHILLAIQLATLVAFSLISVPEAHARNLVSCETERSFSSLGVETTRVWDANGKGLNGPSLLFITSFGLPCITVGAEGRLGFASSEESDNFGDGIDPFGRLHVRLFEFANLGFGFTYINFPPVSSTSPNERGVGDVFTINGDLSVPYSIVWHGTHTLKPIFSVYHYRPKDWDSLLSAEEGIQIRGLLSYTWSPDDKLNVFLTGGVLYDPGRTLVFEKGLVGQIELGASVAVHKYLIISLIGKMWIQQDENLDGPPVFNIPTPVGVISLDAREERDRYSGRAQLLFTVPYDLF